MNVDSSAGTRMADSRETDDLDLGIWAIQGDSERVSVGVREDGTAGLVAGSSSEANTSALLLQGCAMVRRCTFGDSALKSEAVRRGIVPPLLDRLAVEEGVVEWDVIIAVGQLIRLLVLRASDLTNAVMLEHKAVARLTTALASAVSASQPVAVDALATTIVALLTPPTDEAVSQATEAGVLEVTETAIASFEDVKPLRMLRALCA
jgi:hypothetical protein